MPQSLDRRIKPQVKLGSVTKAAMTTEAMDKTASFGGYAGFGGGQVVRMNPKPYSPIYDDAHLMMPRDRREGNAWARHFYATDPIVRNALDLHTRYPLSKFEIKCPYPKVRSFFEEMSENINLYETVLGAGLEYWKIGEVFPEAELDEDKGVWSHIVIHNPDYIDVKSSILAKEPMIMLIPDDELKRIVTSPNPDDLIIRSQMDREVISYILAGQNIPLNNFNVSYIVNKASPYDKRGTSILECLYKDLMLRDKYREANYAIADNHVTPLKVFKIGDDKHRPTPEELGAFRDTLEEATYDHNFSLVYHQGLTIEYVGSNGSILDLTSEYERIERMLFTGLFTSQTIAAGDGPSYSGTEVALDVLQQRYLAFRQQIEHWIERKIFRPIAHIQDFYEWEPGTKKKKLIVPKVAWQKINLKNNKELIDTLIGLAESKKVSYSRVFSMMDLDFYEELTTIEDEQKRIQKLEKILQAIGGEEGTTEDTGSDLDLPDLGSDLGSPDLGGTPEMAETPEAAPAEPETPEEA